MRKKKRCTFDPLSRADPFDESRHRIIARLAERIGISSFCEIEIKFRISAEPYLRIAA